MIEVACECDDGFGVAHSHTYEFLPTVVYPAIPGVRGPRPVAERRDTGWVRIWVDWPEVAKQLIMDTFYVVGREAGYCLHGPYDHAAAQAIALGAHVTGNVRIDENTRVVKATGYGHSRSLVGR